MSDAGEFEGSQRALRECVEPCPSCHGSGEIGAEVSSCLAPDEQIVESLQVLAGAQVLRVELIRGPGGESLRVSALAPSTGGLAPLLFDDTLAQQLQRVVVDQAGGLRRFLDALSRSWTRRSGR